MNNNGRLSVAIFYKLLLVVELGTAPAYCGAQLYSVLYLHKKSGNTEVVFKFIKSVVVYEYPLTYFG